MTKDELAEALADRMIDQMDMQTMSVLVWEYLIKAYEGLTEEQLRAEVAEYAEDLLEQDHD